MTIVGKTIGRYEILEHIGEGGMAQVYKAYDPGIQRTAALKILKREHCADDEHKQRFLREGKAAGALTHPNIVTIYDVGEIDGAPYIMMELLEGDTLADLLRADKRPSIQSVIRIGRQLAMALDYAHSKGVVHRDMKPDNIIVGPDGETIKIADFGIARVEDRAGKDTTQVGMMLGTPRYMSPEQAAGDTVDGRSDLFAVGVILYEIITGQKAFDAETITTLVMQIAQKDPVPIRQITSDAPVGLQKIVNKLLQKKPERRFQTGAELQLALERELATLRQAQEESRGYLSIQVKWTAIMATVVALAMALCATLIYRAQERVLEQQAIDSGLALGRFIAVQAAIPVLGEDWVTLDSLVQDAAARDSFSYLIVSDHRGTVRSASDSELVGEPWQPDHVMQTLLAQGGVEVTDRDRYFNFRVPVLFNQTVVGRVDLGLSTRALDEALATTARMMVALGFAIVLAVTSAIYIFNKLAVKNLTLAAQALQLFRRGNLETRISRTRSDEFGALFTAFNEMADTLEKKVEGSDIATELKGESTAADRRADISGITRAQVEDQTVVRSPDEPEAD